MSNHQKRKTTGDSSRKIDPAEREDINIKA